MGESGGGGWCCGHVAVMSVCSPALTALHLRVGRVGGCFEARAGVFGWVWDSAFLFADALLAFVFLRIALVFAPGKHRVSGDPFVKGQQTKAYRTY